MGDHFRFWLIFALVFAAIAGIFGLALQIASGIEALFEPRSGLFGDEERTGSGIGQNVISAGLWLSLMAACFGLWKAGRPFFSAMGQWILERLRGR